MFDTSEEKTKEIIDSILTWDVTPQVVPDAPKIAEPPVDMSKHDCVQLAITTIKEKRKEVSRISNHIPGSLHSSDLCRDLRCGKFRRLETVGPAVLS